jgi:hypothetical protein
VLPKIIDHEKDGLIIPDLEPKTFTQIILDLISDIKLRSRLEKERWIHILENLRPKGLSLTGYFYLLKIGNKLTMMFKIICLQKL